VQHWSLLITFGDGDRLPHVGSFRQHEQAGTRFSPGTGDRPDDRPGDRPGDRNV